MKKERTIHDEVEAFKEAIDWTRIQMGPANAERLKARVDRLFRRAMSHGIRLAAAVAADYDATNSHPTLVSDCILGKLNLRRRAPRKNPTQVDGREPLFFSDQELGVLRRSLLRSLDETPERERKRHKALYDTLSAVCAQRLTPSRRAAIERALDRAIGR